MLIPLRDDNPTRTTPVVTISLIIVNVVVFLYQSLMSLDVASLKYALIPAALTGSVPREAIAAHVLMRHGHPPGLVETLGIHGLHPEWLSIFTSMFMHGGWMHLIGNMLYLWICGNNVEDVLGKGRFLGFYLLCGLGAALAQVVLGPTSTVPMVGASGAIAGVLGAYLVLFPGARILHLVFLFIFVTTFEIPAFISLGFWFLMNLVNAFVGIGGNSSGGGVAYMAHIGGFALGWLLIRVFGDRFRQMPPSYVRHRSYPGGYGDWR